MSPLVRTAGIAQPEGGSRIPIIVNPETAGWRYTSLWTYALPAGDDVLTNTDDREVVIVPLRGKGMVTTPAGAFRLDRTSVFEQLPRVLYLPPKTRFVLAADSDFEVALGAAPAEGKLPVRLFEPQEMKIEIRGEANARRQITHILAPPLPAERLVMFEVYTPSGNWSSWPPHCHDGRLGSPEMEEVYYYRIRPREGFAIQRIYTGGEEPDELMMPRHGDAVIVPGGHHPVVAAPGSNVYYLNVLAGPQRSTAVADDPHYKWMREDWTGKAMKLPVGG